MKRLIKKLIEEVSMKRKANSEEEENEIIVDFNGDNCYVEKSSYGNGQIRIQLYDVEDGMPYATASVALEGVKLASDEVAIKDYSENRGILEALINGGVISQPIKEARTGHVVVPICRVLI